MSAILANLEPLERALTAKHFPAMSPWWRATLSDFYQGNRRQLVLRVGRRGGKSSTLCRIAVLEALFGAHVIPPGDIGVVAIISTTRDEAAQRLRTVKAILDALSIKYRAIDHGIELDHKPVAFKTFVASVSGVSGFTAICIIADEVAKWRDADTGANPCTEVLASLRPTLATMPNARLFLSSSPVGREDGHAKMFDGGDTAFQSVAHAATWEANPSISEAQTHLLESDARVWRREYGAIPQTSALGAFEVDAIEAAFRPFAVGKRCGAPIISMDPAGRGSDAFAYVTAGWVLPAETISDEFQTRPAYDRNGADTGMVELILGVDGRPIRNSNYRSPSATFYFGGWQSIDAGYRAAIGAEEIARRIAKQTQEHGAAQVITDQFESFSLEALLRRYRVSLTSIPWTSGNKSQAVTRLRRLLNERAIVFEKDAKGLLYRELSAYEERVTPNGVTYGGTAPGGGHFDLLSCVLTATMGDMLGMLYGGIGAKNNSLRSGWGVTPAASAR